jgi:uncharacterized membrane protein YuzA (DUF378 family)
MMMKSIDMLAAILVVVGALNWGLVGVAQFDLVAALFGAGSALASIVYILVGLAGLFQAVQWKAIQRRWGLGVAPATA